MKLTDAFEGYWLDKRLTMSDTTIPGYEKTFSRLLDFLGDVEMESITANDVRRFLAHLPDVYELSRRTVSDSWVPLSSLWTWAEIELGIPHVIRGRVKRPTFTRRVIEPFSYGQVRAMVVAAGQAGDTLRNVAILLTLLDTGLRASELCALVRTDYDNGRIHVQQGKGNKGRFVVVGNRTQKVIWRYLTDAPAHHMPLFSTKTGNHLSRYGLRRIVQRIGERAGVEGVHPHRFRHTFAITFLRNGGNVLEFKELLGHESLTMVMRYAMIADQDIEASRKRSPVDNWRLSS